MKYTAVVVAVFLAHASPALALNQPTGAPIPSEMGCDGGKPTGLAATFACVCDTPGACNIGDPCPDESSCDDGINATCETTIWHEFNDNTCIPSNLSGLDPEAEAAVLPETFTPTCPLTFTVVTRGTAIFGDAFGWYNVTGEKPGLDDLHVMLDCAEPSGAQIVLDVRGDPAYAGGDIGFFIATPESHTSGGTCAGGNCCADLSRVAAGEGHVYYSERGYNPDAAGDSSFIHLVIYDSHIENRKFYFTWEDIYGGSNNDFTDLVTSVSGVECAGGGSSCDTGQAGVCRHGVSACKSGDIDCVQLYPSGPELCDGLDNDCNGTVDEEAPCPANELCYNGRCVPHCEFSNEFDCDPSLVCNADTGLCVDPGCADTECPPDKICRGGECVTPCDDIVCPHGLICRFGDCIDPCTDVTCGEREVCREGLCFPGCSECDGILCDSDFACDISVGECVDPSCPQGCPDGTYCDDGTCVDSCDGAVCPNGLFCVNGECTDEDDPDPNSDGGPGADDDDDGTGPGGGCGCAKGTSPQETAANQPLLLLIGLLFLRRRRD